MTTKTLFLWTQLSVLFADIQSIEKKATMFGKLQDAIEITTKNETIFLDSFVSRDEAFEIMQRLWKNPSDEDPVRALKLSEFHSALQIDSTEALITCTLVFSIFLSLFWLDSHNNSIDVGSLRMHVQLEQ